MKNKKNPHEANTSSEETSLLCTLPRTTLLSKPMGSQPRTGYQPVDLCPTTTTPSMQVNPYSYGMQINNPSCDTDPEYASVLYSSSPTIARHTRLVQGNRAQYTMSPRSQNYLSPQLARLNSTLRQPSSSANGSPVHRYHASAMSSTTTLSTCLSPRSGRYQLSDTSELPNASYDPNLHHVYCEIPMFSKHRLQQHLRSKLRQHPSSLTDETEFYEDTTHNISDLSEDEYGMPQMSELSFQSGSKHSTNSPKHYPRRQQLLNNGSPSHNNKKRAATASNRHHHLSPPPLKSHTKDSMSQLPATDV